MPNEIISSLNWVDIILLIIIIRIIYIGVKRGFAVEFSKIIGLVVAAIVSYHYYIFLSDFIVAHSPVPTGFSDLICFVLLLLVVDLLFALFRQGMAMLIKVEPVPFLNTWGGFLLGVLRSGIFCSVFLYILFISGFGYIEKSARQSYAAGYFARVAPAIYSFTHESIINKLFPEEQINTSVFEAINSNQAPERKSK